MSFFAPYAVWEAGEFQTFKGRAAIRALLEDWLGTYEDPEVRIDDASELGNGVLFVTATLDGRLAGSTAEMRVRFGAAYEWVDSQIVRISSYSDIDETRALAERLAEERR